MSRKVVALTLTLFDQLTDPGLDSLFWELDPVSRGRLDAEQARAQKRAWIGTVQRDWGSCGRVVTVDNRAVGYLLYAPPAFVPGAASLATAPASPDSVLLTTAWVQPGYRHGGLGRMLIQGMAKDLVKRGGFSAVEAFASYKPRQHLIPEGFLGGVGFTTQRAHPKTPRMRMELRSAIKVRDEVEQALERLAGLLKPARGATGGVSRSLNSVRSAERSSGELPRST